MTVRPTINVRYLKDEDIRACVEIAFECWPDSDRVRRHLTHELLDITNYTVVAETDKKIVGWASWTWSRVSYDIAEFVWCNIKPAYQRQGIGKVLTQVRIDSVRFQDGKAIILTTGHPEVYAKYGFETVKVLPLWIGPETHFMIKQL